MHVAVDGHGGANLVVALHAADGDRHIVDHAESLAMVGEGMVESSANADADFVGQGLARREDGSPGREPEGLRRDRGSRGFPFPFLRVG